MKPDNLKLNIVLFEYQVAIVIIIIYFNINCKSHTDWDPLALRPNKTCNCLPMKPDNLKLNIGHCKYHIASFQLIKNVVLNRGFSFILFNIDCKRHTDWDPFFIQTYTWNCIQSRKGSSHYSYNSIVLWTKLY